MTAARRLLPELLAAAGGAAAAVLLDPASGRRRRKIAVDRLGAASRRGGRTAMRAVCAAAGTVQGLGSRVRHPGGVANPDPVSEAENLLHVGEVPAEGRGASGNRQSSDSADEEAERQLQELRAQG